MTSDDILQTTWCIFDTAPQGVPKWRSEVKGDGSLEPGPHDFRRGRPDSLFEPLWIVEDAAADGYLQF